ncbi:hypothetical protein Tco_0757522 [Tanacetum coccineum]
MLRLLIYSPQVGGAVSAFQAIDELLQTLPSFDPTCYSEKENSLPYVSKPNFVDDSPNAFNPPPQPPMYSYEFCGNDARYGHYCLGFDSGKASTSGTKTMSFVGSSAEKAMDGSTIKVHGSTLPGSVCLRTCLEPDEWIKDSGCSKHMTGNKSLFSTYKAYDGGNVVFGSNLKGKIIGKVEESLNVTFDESPPSAKLSPLVDEDVGEEKAIKRNTKVVNNNNEEDESIEVDEIVNIKESKNHPLDQVIGNLNQRTLRS